MNNFYIYYLRRPDKEDPLEPEKGQPFYVGKGSNGRANSHRKEAEKLRNKPGRKIIKVTIIHKLWKYGLDFEETIEFENLNEQEAFEIELEAIQVYGRIDTKTGCLANMTNGGEGGSGLFITEETKKKISKSLTGKIRSIEHRRNLSKANTGHKTSEETKRKLSEAGKGKSHTEETKKRLSKILTGHKISEETKAKISKANSGKTPSEETRRKISEKNKGKSFGGPKSGKDHFFFGKHHTEETKKKISIANSGRKVIFTMEHRKRLSLANKNRPIEQEILRREKISHTKKLYWQEWRNKQEGK